ncbi:MAG: PAS domain-containing sensor histidine kinase [Candidatus Hodarchaeales archaeon]
MNSLDPPFDQDFLDKLPAGIIILKDRRIYYTNTKVRIDLNIPTAQRNLSVEQFVEFLVPSEREKFARTVANRDMPLPKESEWQALLPDGTSTWIQVRVSSIDERYDMVLIRHIGKLMQIRADLDAQQKQQKQFQDLFSKSPNFLFIFKNGCIDYYNRAFVEKLGYSELEIEERKCLPTFFVAPEHRARIASYLLETKRDLFTGKIADNNSLDTQIVSPDETSELELLCKDGSRIPVMASVKKLYIGNTAIVQGIMVDLSPIKQLTDLKFDFLTLSQHTLRTPISNLRGHLDFYTSRLVEGITSEEKEILEANMLSAFGRNLSQLEAIVNDLNDIAAVQMGKFKCTLILEDLVPILQQAIDGLEFILKRYRVHLVIEYPTTPFVINVDRIRMLQALRNIFENAIRFTGHGAVEISLTSIEDNKIARLICKDSGVGINKENLQHIGEPFKTFHTSASQLGLGVFLAKQVISDHGGSFIIESEGFNQGSVVTIDLPLLIPPEESEEIEGKTSLNELIKQASTSQNYITRLDAVQQLGNIDMETVEEPTDILSVLEQIILHDTDRTIRNLASTFYSKIKTEIEEKVTSL